MNQGQTPIQKISQIAVPVQDVPRAVEFYQNILGLSLLFTTESMAFFDCAGIRLLLSLPEKEQFARASSVLYFQVEDIHSSFDQLKQQGVSFVDQPHVVAKMNQMETWMVFFTDPDQNTHALVSEVSVSS